jgi:Mn-dependent DtxR family transcriptional regulator
MKDKKRVDERTRLEAIKIFGGTKGNLTNEKIAARLNISIRRVSQMRKEYNQTGTIKLTMKNYHTIEF